MIQNKYIIRLSFIGLFLNIIANIVMYRYFMIEEVVLKQTAQNNNYLVRVYQHEIWDQNKEAINELNTKNDKTIFANQNVINYIYNSIRFFQNINSIVNIYNKNGNKIITNSHKKENYQLIDSNHGLYDIILSKLDSAHRFLRNLLFYFHLFRYDIVLIINLLNKLRFQNLK